MSEEKDADPAEVKAAVADLLLVSQDHEQMARLHAIEQLMVQDALMKNDHLTCKGCVYWMRALARKARGEAWRSDEQG